MAEFTTAARITTNVRSVREAPALPNDIVTMNYADVNRDDGERGLVDTLVLLFRHWTDKTAEFTFTSRLAGN